MEYVLPNGGIIRGIKMITIDERGVSTCIDVMSEELTSDMTQYVDVNGFAPKKDREARRLERAIERSSEKSGDGACYVLKAKQTADRVRVGR